MRKIFARWVFYLLTLTFILGYQTPLEAKKSPNFWIRNLEGDRFDTRRHKGTYVISFFFVNCVPCIKEIPELHSMVTKEFPNTKLLFIDPVDEDTENDMVEELHRKLKKMEERRSQDLMEEKYTKINEDEDENVSLMDE